MANFSKMYEQYVEQVYCFLRELSGDDSSAEELTRKTFYQAFLRQKFTNIKPEISRHAHQC